MPSGRSASQMHAARTREAWRPGYGCLLEKPTFCAEGSHGDRGNQGDGAQKNELLTINKKIAILFLINSTKIQQKTTNFSKGSPLTAYVRRQSLLEMLRKQPGLRVSELAKALSVSEGTIRNDLNALEEEGRLTRVHGGAILNDQEQFQNNSFLLRFRQNSAAKTAIARRAAELVEDGDSILLDASSTAYYLALELSGRKKLRVMTNGFEVARELAQNSTNTVILIGGVVNNDSSSVTGLLSEQIIAEMHIEKAFFSCSGFSIQRGMTEVHLEEAQLKRMAIGSSKQIIALIDSSKFGKEDLTPFARPDQVTRLFTDSGLTPEWATKLKKAAIDLTICEQEAMSVK
jgi:DeoR/GlpR family transcriptional regulator of sugar metabolism